MMMHKPIDVPAARCGSFIAGVRVMPALIGAAVLAALSGCTTSPPRPEFPDGSTRVPVNTEQQVVQVQQQAQADKALLFDRDLAAREKAVLLAEIDVLRNQVKGLREILRTLAQDPAQANRLGANTARQPFVGVVPTVPPAAPAHTVTPGASRESLAMQLIDGAQVFRVFMPFGSAVFAPPLSLQRPLLDAAAAAQRIDVAGMTDSVIDDVANQQVARARATNARNWLVRHGVPAAVITEQSHASGHFIAENKSRQGRALNRRAEIVIYAGTSQEGQK